MNRQILPWQTSQWEQLQQYKNNNRLPHALLLVGPAGVGKTDFAKVFAQSLLCEGKTNKPCGTCRHCSLLNANNHPDYFDIKPDETSRVIKIDQIRQLIEAVSKTAHVSDAQIVLVNPADMLNRNAANALLKTLEEPSGKIIIFLIDNQKSVLPATIMSRCQKIFFSSDYIDLRLQNNDITLRDQLLNHLDLIQARRVNSITLNPAWLKITLENIFQQAAAH